MCTATECIMYTALRTELHWIACQDEDAGPTPSGTKQTEYISVQAGAIVPLRHRTPSNNYKTLYNSKYSILVRNLIYEERRVRKIIEHKNTPVYPKLVL